MSRRWQGSSRTVHPDDNRRINPLTAIHVSTMTCSGEAFCEGQQGETISSDICSCKERGKLPKTGRFPTDSGSPHDTSDAITSQTYRISYIFSSMLVSLSIMCGIVRQATAHTSAIVAVRISHTSPMLNLSHLCSFTLCVALPRALVGRDAHDYYEHSVAIGLAPVGVPVFGHPGTYPAPCSCPTHAPECPLFRLHPIIVSSLTISTWPTPSWASMS